MSQDEKLNKNMSITFEFHVASDYISLTYQKKKKFSWYQRRHRIPNLIEILLDISEINFVVG
jgi:hypothetical protein